MASNLKKILPASWIKMDLEESFEIFELKSKSHEYKDIQELLLGDYYSSVDGLFKIQNPAEYAKFNLKRDQYSRRGKYQIVKLFHDTAQDNINSIAEYNLRTLCAKKCKLGTGIYFCTDPAVANRRCNITRGECRAMFVVDVLIQNPQTLKDDARCVLPNSGYDTVIGGTFSPTYVKYFDSEFYPSYFMTYVSKEFVKS